MSAASKLRKGSLLLFRLGTRRFALPVAALVGVTEALHIAPIPHRAGTALLGLVAFEGEVLPCFSLPRLMNLQAGAHAAAKTLILEETPGRNWAVPVDAVDGMQGLGNLWTLDGTTFSMPDGSEFDLINAEALFRQMRLAVA